MMNFNRTTVLLIVLSVFQGSYALASSGPALFAENEKPLDTSKPLTAVDHSIARKQVLTLLRENDVDLNQHTFSSSDFYSDEISHLLKSENCVRSSRALAKIFSKNNDYESAAYWSLKATYQGSLLGATIYAYLLYQNQIKTDRPAEINKAIAVQILKAAAQGGRSQAQLFYGWYLSQRIHNEYNPMEAIDWLFKSAEQRCSGTSLRLSEIANDESLDVKIQAHANYRLGRLLQRFGREDLKEDLIKNFLKRQQAVRALFQKSSDGGHHLATLTLAALCCVGDKNYEKAFQLCSKISDEGNGHVSLFLASLYCDGHGCDQDYITALWYVKKGLEQCLDDFDLREMLLKRALKIKKCINDTLR